MWISFTKFSSFILEELLGSIWGAVTEVLKMIREALHSMTVRTLCCQ